MKNSEVQKLLEKTSDFAEHNFGKLKETVGVRKFRTPLKLRQTSASEDFVSGVGESKWKREYMETLELVVAELNPHRFNHKGMNVAVDGDARIDRCAESKKVIS